MRTSKYIMKHDKLFKHLSIGLFAVITAILMVATIMEKLYGTEYALENIYCAHWMIALWTAATLSAIAYILQRKLHKRPATLCIHLAFAVILIGALVTHTTGKRGQIHLREGEYTNEYVSSENTEEKFPFSISLDSFTVKRHAGTTAPMNFISSIVIYDNERIEGSVSMNNIFKHRGYRFYQAGYDNDEKGTSLSITYDPWGVGITYAGYVLLLLSMLLFFVQRNSRFRNTLHKVTKHARESAMVLIMLVAATTASAEEKPRTLPADIAEIFCDVHVQHNNRICPLQTLAIDFTAKIYGKRSYKEYTAEQVLCGWLFFYDDWEHEPMIEIKSSEVRKVLGIEGAYASLADFTDSLGYKLEQALHEKSNSELNDFVAANEKFNVINMLASGALLKIFPRKNPITEEIVWNSYADGFNDDIPRHLNLNFIAIMATAGNHESIKAVTENIKCMQTKRGGESIPSATAFNAEKLYNDTNSSKPLAIVCLVVGTLLFILSCSGLANGKAGSIVKKIMRIVAWVIVVYISMLIILRWYVGGHMPLSNGHETMMFMAWCSMLLTALSAGCRIRMVQPFGYMVSGLALLVAGLGETTPQITPLIPVLQSPLLCIHVVVIMISYTLFAFTMLGGIAAFITKAVRKNAEREIIELQRTSLLMLYPAVFLLTAGIFIGAVWANISWGRYWGWDPKEVWALITMLVYSVTLHTGSIKQLQRPMLFHAYCIIAFLTVIITYFGVNFILGGMHSYA